MRRIVHAVAFGRDPSGAAHAGAAAMQATHARWWDGRNVVGMCFARKLRRGRVEDLALQVFVKRKRPKDKVPAHRMVAPAVALAPLGLSGRVDTDVREVGVGRLDVLVTSDRPAHPGYNIGHRVTGSGTLGCVVRRQASHELVGLSCAHVIARDGNARPGERVLVPSLIEARRNDIVSESLFGTVSAVAPLGFRFEDGATNVDAATVLPDDPQALADTFARIGVRPAGIAGPVDVDLPVRKVGSTSELTLGTVEGTQLLASFHYVDANDNVRTAWFSDHIAITSFAYPGDSGAIVLDEAARAVGMHLGSYDGVSVCTPMRRVLDAVRCDLP
ncbi:MAG TPA: hypothetical protein VKE22_05585 [Haliangiales bacterium]|nr:hypothetical protein [Haliangiales bacterium]